MERKSLLSWIWLSLALGAANSSTSLILSTFGNADAVFNAKRERLLRLEGLSKGTLRALCNKSLSRAVRILDLCERKGISLLVYTDERFPDVLRTVKMPPVLFYYRGVLPDLNRRFCVAAVGTRSMSEYGMTAAYKISYGLARANAVVVSGMARGIDGVCSAAALAAGGETVVILGCGVDVVYPKQHRALYDEICRHGAVMSEYPPTTLPLGSHFPERNRLICGMCYVTVAFEGNRESGAMITARNALEEGREVYALPGDVDRENSLGMNLLLDEGARPLRSAREILSAYSHIHRSISMDLQNEDGEESLGVDAEQLERLGVLRRSRRDREKTSDDAARKTSPSAENGKQAIGETQEPPSEEPYSEEMLAALPPVQAAILRCVQEHAGGASADEVYALPFSYGEISSAMTQLEIRRLIQRLPGSMIGRG